MKTALALILLGTLPFYFYIELSYGGGDPRNGGITNQSGLSLTKEIQVRDYPHLDPNSREERQRFSGLACEMKLQNPMWSHFVFKVSIR